MRTLPCAIKIELDLKEKYCRLTYMNSQRKNSPLTVPLMSHNNHLIWPCPNSSLLLLKPP